MSGERRYQKRPMRYRTAAARRAHLNCTRKRVHASWRRYLSGPLSLTRRVDALRREVSAGAPRSDLSRVLAALAGGMWRALCWTATTARGVGPFSSMTPG